MDDIQRKLALIDQQLAGRDFHRRIIDTCPLVFVGTGLIAGILVQTASGISVYAWLIFLVVSAVAAVFMFFLPQVSSVARYVTAYLALTCFVCLGAIRLTSYSQPEANNIRNFVAGEPRLAAIRGSIVTEPYISKYPDWKFARFKPTDPTSSFYLRINDVETVHGWAKVTGTIRVQVDEPVVDLKAGDFIQIYCWLDRFSPPTNPGQFDTAGYLARRNVFVGASVRSRGGIKLLQNINAGYFSRLKSRIRQAATQALLGDLPQEGSGRGLLEALLLGYRKDIDSSTYRAFRETGLLHFISLSGMHLGILFGIIWWISKTAGLMKPERAIVCALAIGVFLLIVPPRAPTLRAAIICWIFCASLLFRRRSNPVNTIFLAAIILLLIRPTQIFEAGWQLSFASVLGILLFTERIEGLIHEQLPDSMQSVQNIKSRWYSLVGRKIGFLSVKLFAVGLAAWLGSAGILLYHFYTINPFTSIWTVLVFPLVSAILVLGFLKMLLFFLLPTLSGVVGVLVTFLSDVFVRIVELIAHLDISQILIGNVTLMPVILYYSLIIFAGFVHFRRPLLKKVICTVMFLTMVIYLGALKLQRTHRDNLMLSCLDVGHGQAILVRLPGKTNILFDAGSMYRSDIGTRTVSPFLDYIGIARIDALVISHNDVDHTNGIPEIAEHCEVVDVYANKAFFQQTDLWGTAKFLENCLREKGREIKRLDKDLCFNSSAKIKMIWPGEIVSDSDNLSDNDKSLVCLIEFAGIKILLCSDIETFAQSEILRIYPDLKANIVVLPHHGLGRTLNKEFLGHLEADILISSCDKNQFQRTDKDLDAMSSVLNKARLFNTSKDGAVSIVVNRDGTVQTEVFRE